jgi:hypothetical protein
MHAQPWWLDTVCGAGNWGLCLSWDGEGAIDGALPYTRRPWLGLPMLRMPRFTPCLHLYCRDSKRLAEILPALIKQLPRAVYVSQQYDWALKEAAFFSDSGYRVQQRHTRVLPLEPDVDKLFQQLPARTRNYLNRPWGELQLERGTQPELLFELAQMGKRAPGYEPELLRQLYDALIQRNAGQLYLMYDSNWQLHAAGLVARDSQCAYFLTGAFNPAFPRSQAMRRLLWQAIEDAAAHGCQQFDFQGSMDAGVDRFFSSFGAQRVPYHRILWP